jgi:glucose-1-phosphate cytidylyltransferase
MLTYGDGIGDVDLEALLRRHRDGGRVGTVTAVHPGSRYGEMKVDSSLTAVSEFNEKPTLADGWVSGGLLRLRAELRRRLPRRRPRAAARAQAPAALAADGQLSVSPHEGSGWAWTPSGTGPSSTSSGTGAKHLGRVWNSRLPRHSA